MVLSGPLPILCLFSYTYLTSSKGQGPFSCFLYQLSTRSSRCYSKTSTQAGRCTAIYLMPQVWIRMESSNRLSWSYITRRRHRLSWWYEESSSCCPIWGMYMGVGTGIQSHTYPPTLQFTLLLMFYDSTYETEYASLKNSEGKEI